MAASNPSKKSAGARELRGENRPRRRRPFFNRAFVKNTISLNETHCIMLMEDAKRAVFTALYYMEGVLPFVTTEKKEIRAVNRMLDDLIEESARKLADLQVRLDALCKDNAISTELAYDNPATPVSVYVHSPRIARYAALLEPFDRIIGAATSLWLAGVIDEVERSEIIMDGRRAVRRAGNRIIALKLRSWKAINNSADKSLKGILVERESVPEDEFIADPNPTALPGVAADGEETASVRAKTVGLGVETAAVDTVDAGVESVGSVGSDVKQKKGESKPKTETVDAAPSSEGSTKNAVTKPAGCAKPKASTKAKTAAKQKSDDIDLQALSGESATAPT